ncbi:MAG TPA: class I SAM-dependent methyltransferase [Casimicrobiaceae bacterium]|nr:class I SAM-dependent methyltransferase [Casimicrobiaceae bacterium]
MTTFDDEFYRDILAGLAVYTDSDFVRDILATLGRHQEPGIAVALNRNQVASKRWLVDTLHATSGGRYGTVVILGGWLGALGAMLLHDRRFDIDRVVSVDIDPRCADVACSLNATHVRAGRFEARTADMRELDHAAEVSDLLINTSCEHVEGFDRWYTRVPDGQRLVLQSNDYVAVPEHVNCVRDLAEFRAQAPMRETLFAGARALRRYTRFMLIGRK